MVRLKVKIYLQSVQNLSFNSKMVRLKARRLPGNPIGFVRRVSIQKWVRLQALVFGKSGRIMSFNSKMVRLKGNAPVGDRM